VSSSVSLSPPREFQNVIHYAILLLFLLLGRLEIFFFFGRLKASVFKKDMEERSWRVACCCVLLLLLTCAHGFLQGQVFSSSPRVKSSYVKCHGPTKALRAAKVSSAASPLVQPKAPGKMKTTGKDDFYWPLWFVLPLAPYRMREVGLSLLISAMKAFGGRCFFIDLLIVGCNSFARRWWKR
jgi:hypothetical protein